MSRFQRTRRHALSIGLVGVLLLAGCSALPTGALSDADTVSESVQQRYDRIESYTATVTKTVTTPSQTASVQATLSVDTDDQMQVAYHTGTRAGTVETIDLSTANTAQPVLSTGLQRVNGGQSVSYGALAATLVQTNNITLERTTTILGQQAAVISLVPHTEKQGSTSIKRQIWVDTERLVPLKIETTWTSTSGQTVTETVRYTNVTIHEQNTSTQAATAHSGVGA